MIKVAAVSDIHGYLPEIPECDLLLLAGDYCPDSNIEYEWFRDNFSPWLNELGRRGDIQTIVGVAGNHDWMFQKRPELVHKIPLDWKYLQDSGCTDFIYDKATAKFRRLNFWGSPWQKRFFDWAFNLDEVELKEKWDLIPSSTDILLLHGPPYMYGDYSNYGKEHCGSPSLTERIREIKPKLVICGHIHLSRGIYILDDTVIGNVSYVDEKYKPCNKPMIFELHNNKITWSNIDNNTNCIVQEVKWEN